MIVDTALRGREAADHPIRVGMVGAESPWGDRDPLEHDRNPLSRSSDI
jgi:hypothetical protein